MTEPNEQAAHIEVRDLTMAYGSAVIQRDLNFNINSGDIFVIMGGSGCGKSTLLKHMLGLIQPNHGDILYNGTSFFQASDSEQGLMRQGWGISYQSGGLFSAMTLGENITLPLELYTRYTTAEITDIVAYKLAAKHDYIAIIQDRLLRFIIAFYRVIPPSQYHKLGC